MKNNNKFLTTNNKTLGLLYIVFGIFGGCLGTMFSILVRRERGVSGLVLGSSQSYNVRITAHAVLIIFFIVIPVLLGGFGN
jgi:cytochrome c oxidase subunit 1